MRKCLLLAAAACSLASIAAAAEPAREASEILKEYDAVTFPVADRSRLNDDEYRRQFAEAIEAANAKRNALAEELYKAHPQVRRAASLMADRLFRLINYPDDPTKGIEEAEQFVRDRAKDDMSAAVLLAAAHRLFHTDKEKSLAISRRIVAEYPPTENTKKAEGTIRRLEGIGKPFELSFTDAITDQPISMKNLRGKVVVIDFWATWCASCVAEMPKLKELYAQYKDQGVEFIGVNMERPGEGLNLMKAFVMENGITWPQYYEGNWWAGEFSRSWGVSPLPTTFIVDAEGNLYSTDAERKLDKLIPELIKKRDR